METLIIIALIVGGLILFAIEVFLIPGISGNRVGGMHPVCHLFRLYITRFGGRIHYLRSFPAGYHRRHMVVHAL